VKTLLAAIFGTIVICAMLALGCTTPQPVPDPPPQPVPVDMFDGAVADCSRSASDAPVDLVRTCADLANTSGCLVDLYPANTPDTIACTARALSMSLHSQIERTGGSDQMKAEVAALDAWIRNHKIGYR